MERHDESDIINKSASAYDYTINAAAGCQGLVICIGNGLLFATIITEKSLRSRKEMRIIAGMAVADFLVGGGALTLSIYRLIMLSIGCCSQRILTAWDCVRRTPAVSVYIGGHLSYLMSFIVSVDRYLAVAKPAFYRRLDDGYTRYMLGAATVYGILSITGLILSTYFGTERIPNFTVLCTGWVFPIWYGIYLFGIGAILSCTSVAIYAAVFASYRNRRKHSIISNRDEQKTFIQRRLTVTLGIISVCTLTFHVAPIAYLAVVTTSQPYLMAMLTRISTIVNISIYVYRQEEIRFGMWKVMTCRACGTGSRDRWSFSAARTMKESLEFRGSIAGKGEQSSQDDSEIKEALSNVIDDG